MSYPREYNISLSATDEYNKNNELANKEEYEFKIVVTNQNPTVKGEIGEEAKSLRLGRSYDYTFPASLFEDVDGDVLNYEVEVTYSPEIGIEKKEILQALGTFWLKFDASARKLYGKPEVKDLLKGEDRYEQIFKIKITATDIGNKKVSKEYELKVSNEFPKLNEAKKIKDQAIHVGNTYDYVIPSNTFVDDDDVLKYQIQRVMMKEDFNGMNKTDEEIFEELSLYCC